MREFIKLFLGSILLTGLMLGLLEAFAIEQEQQEKESLYWECRQEGLTQEECNF